MVLAGGVFLWPCGLRAADPQPQGTVAPENADNFDLDLPDNMTVGEVIALLKKKFPELNYRISSPALESVKLQEVKVRHANIDLLARALEFASNDQIGCGWDRDLKALIIAPTGRAPMAVVNVFNIGAWMAPSPEEAKKLDNSRNRAQYLQGELSKIPAMSSVDFFNEYKPSDATIPAIHRSYLEMLGSLDADEIKKMEGLKKQLDAAAQTDKEEAIKKIKTALDAVRADEDMQRIGLINAANDKLNLLHQMLGETIASVNKGKGDRQQIAIPELKYYPEGGVLVVIGTPAAQEIIAKIIGALPGGGAQAKPAEPASTAPAANP